MRHTYSDRQSTEAFLYVIGKSNIMLTWTYSIVLDIKGKHNFKHFTVILVYNVEIPTNKEQTPTYLKL